MPVATDVQDTQLLVTEEDMVHSASVKELLKKDEEVPTANTTPAVPTAKAEVSWFEKNKFKRYIS